LTGEYFIKTLGSLAGGGQVVEEEEGFPVREKKFGGYRYSRRRRTGSLYNAVVTSFCSNGWVGGGGGGGSSCCCCLDGDGGSTSTKISSEGDGRK